MRSGVFAETPGAIVPTLNPLGIAIRAGGVFASSWRANPRTERSEGGVRPPSWSKPFRHRLEGQGSLYHLTFVPLVTQSPC